MTVAPGDYLVSLGVDPEVAQWIVEMINVNGHLFKQWGVDPKAAALATSLHDGSWFSVGQLDTAVLAKTGGRQGCKLGGLIFNSSYSVALNMLHAEFRKNGLCLRLQVPNAAFWADGASDETVRTDVIDATFVDDECIVLMARTPALLDKSIEIVLGCLTKIFKLLHMLINWKPGKTEALLKYRGANARKHLENWRGPDGKLSIPVPDRPDDKLHIVHGYKHLGGYQNIDGDLCKDARHKAETAMAAYTPISVKVFGSHCIGLWLKLLFLSSLVMSRLLFNVHTVVPTVSYTRVLNGVYMRALRRISGHLNLGDSISDINVRKAVHQPSLDCLLARARLLYLRRILVNRPVSLLALLHYRPNDQQLPWVKLVLRDLDLMRTLVAQCSRLPSAELCPNDWFLFICRSEVEWSRAVKNLFFYGSCCDRIVDTSDVGVTQWRCGTCSTGASRLCFSSAKALASHCRSKHGVKNPMRFYADASGKCPICSTSFQTRLRCLAHLSDSRRPRCRDKILSGDLQPLALDEVRAMDASDRTARRMAWRSGHTHPLASAPAVKANGQLTGRVRA